MQSPQIVLEEKRCLRNRLRGFSCRSCVDGCRSEALADNDGKVSLIPHKCTNCGACVALCPGDAFSFDRFNLNQLLEENVQGKSLVISCYGSTYRSENELRLPCVGVMIPESLLFLGLRQRGDVRFNLSECTKCSNRLTADAFMQLFQHVQRQAAHLFRSRLTLIRTADELPAGDDQDRRKFLFSLGSTVVNAVQGKFAPETIKKKRPTGTRQVMSRTQLLIRILKHEKVICDELIQLCTPEAQVSLSCTLCPRCTGMCHTGALKIRKSGKHKVLSYDRTLCIACGLCVEFCKEEAISIREPGLVSSKRISCGSPVFYQ